MTGPLAEYKIVEMAGIGPAPHCAMLLAEMGADVIRIDRPVPSGLDAEILGRAGHRSKRDDLRRRRGRRR